MLVALPGGWGWGRTSNVAGDDDAERIAMVRRQQPAIVLEGQDDIASWVQRFRPGDAGPV